MIKFCNKNTNFFRCKQLIKCEYNTITDNNSNILFKRPSINHYIYDPVIYLNVLSYDEISKLISSNKNLSKNSKEIHNFICSCFTFKKIMSNKIYHEIPRISKQYFEDFENLIRELNIEHNNNYEKIDIINYNSFKKFSIVYPTYFLNLDIEIIKQIFKDEDIQKMLISNNLNIKHLNYVPKDFYEYFSKNAMEKE